tara:strand:+ start:5955 stop:6077 length:123 start_codon:yes stop_codon:yes gene_type:complete
METFIVIAMTIAGAFILYMSSHIVEEQKRGKHIPLPWEKD